MGRDNEFYSNSNNILSGLLRRYDGFDGGSCYQLV